MRKIEDRLTGKYNFQILDSEWALFLDFDGTLIDIALSPDSIYIPRELPALIGRLEDVLGGALAIVSGRSIEAIDSYLSPYRPITAGVHGAEIRLGPDKVITTAKPLPPAAVEAVSMISRDFKRTRVEIKTNSVALHYRLNPEAGPLIGSALRRIFSPSSGLAICAGRMVYEVLPAHVSKGGAIDVLLQLPRFSSRRPLVIGDDSSDESAFEAAQRYGGFALTVAGEHFSQDCADFGSPSELRAWLTTFAVRSGK